MTQVTLKIETSADQKVEDWWVAIDDKDVADKINPIGSAKVSKGRHRLSYWALGQPGGIVKINVKQGSKEIFKANATISSSGDVARAPAIEV